MAMDNLRHALYYNYSTGKPAILLSDDDIEMRSLTFNLSYEDKARLFIVDEVVIQMFSTIALQEFQIFRLVAKCLLGANFLFCAPLFMYPTTM